MTKENMVNENMNKEEINKKDINKSDINKSDINKSDINKPAIKASDTRNGEAENKIAEYAAYTYMVRCRDGSLYTGWTNNLEKRVKAHNEGKGAKYTRNRGPVELVYAEMHATKQEAMSREAKIKLLTKKEKEEMAAHYPGNPQHATSQ